MGIKDDAITYRQLRVFREVCAKGTVSRAGYLKIGRASCRERV